MKTIIEEKDRKPILVITVPSYTPQVDLNTLQVGMMSESSLKLKEDYHVLLIIGDVDKMKCELFSTKNIQQVELEKLTEIIEQSLKKNDET